MDELDSLIASSLTQDEQSKYLQELDSITSGSLGTLGGSLSQEKPLTQEEILQRKLDRVSKKTADLTSDDSNLMLKLKSAYNTVNNLWDGQDLKANYMGKEHTMSNKIFEDVNDSMAESEAKKQELIDQYNNAVDDPNAKHKVYQLRIKDGVDANGNQLYTYKTGIAETSAAERYKNQMIKGGYEILGEKGFANAEEWENKWHGLKANIADRTYDEGYNAKGQNLKDFSGFGAGYSELYNTQNFHNGVSNEDIARNRLNSEALADAAYQRKKEGYGKGSDSMVDAFQAGAVKTGLDFVDTALDIVTPGDNTLLDGARDQGAIDKWVGYNRKTADKAIGEATARFNAGDYSGALFEVLKNPQITAESLPANLEMAVGFGKFTKVGKLASELTNAQKANDLGKVKELTEELSKASTASNKLIHNVASNAGFYSQVAQATNNQIDERIANNAEAGISGGDSIVEVGAVFASNFLSLGLDRVAFDKITGIEGGKKSLADAFGFASPDGKRNLIHGVLNQGYKMAENGATEAAQEYVQTWSEIINSQLGTAKNGTLSEIFNSKENQDEAIGAMLAGSAGGIHMGVGSEAIAGTGEIISDELLGGKERKNAERLRETDSVELNNIYNNIRSADGLEGDERVSASKATVGAVARNGHNAVLKKMLTTEPDSNEASVLADKFIKSVANEYLDANGAGSSASSKVLMNRNISAFVGNLFENMNSMQWKSDLAESEYAKAKDAGLVDDTVSPQDFMIDRINRQKELVASAIGKSLDDSGIDISNTIIQRFKSEFVDKPISEAIKSQKNSEDTVENNMKNIGKKDKVSLDGDNTIVTLSREKADDIKSKASILYSISGSKDTDLADIIDQLEKQNGSTVMLNYRSKDVSRNVLRDGTNMGSKNSDKKSIRQHSYDIKESIADEIFNNEESNDSGSLKKVNENINKLIDFADSRAYGIEDYFGGEYNYGSQEDFKNLEKLKEEGESSKDMSKFNAAVKKYVSGLINSIETTHYVNSNGDIVPENKNVKFSQLERTRRTNAPIDEDYMNRFGRKNNTRKIYAGESYNGIMSSISYETDMISNEIDNAINGLNDLKISYQSKGKDTADIDAKIEELKSTKSYIDVSNKVFNEIHKSAQYKNSKYKKQIIKPGEKFIDSKGVTREARLEDIAYELEKEDVEKKARAFKQQTEQDYNSNVIDSEEKDKLIKELEDFIDNFNNSDKVNSVTDIQETINEFDNSGVDYSFLITDNEEASIAKDKIFRLYKNVFKKIKNIVFDKKANETKYDNDINTIFIKIGQDNDMNNAHEMFHALSFDRLSKKLSEQDTAFVSDVYSMLKNDISDNDTKSLSSRSIEELDQIRNSDTDDRLIRELSAILYSNGELRRFIVTQYEKTYNSDKEYSSKRKSMASFIESVFKAYKWVAHTLSRAFSEDDKQINTKSDAYRAMAKFVGNSLKYELTKTSTRNSDFFVKKYDEILGVDNKNGRFKFDDNENLIDTENNNNIVESILRSVDYKEDSSMPLNIEHKGKRLNQRSINTIFMRLKNGTLDKNDFAKLDSILKAYEDKLVSFENQKNGDVVIPKRDIKTKENDMKPESEDSEQAKQENSDDTNSGSEVINEDTVDTKETKEPEVKYVDKDIVNKKADEFYYLIDMDEDRNFNPVSKVISRIKKMNNVTEDVLKDIEDIIEIAKELNKCKGE